MKTALVGLDPLFLTNVKLFISDILNLELTVEHTIDTYKFYNHYIKFAEICGIIVAVETNSKRAIYTVDDGTGTLPCGYWIDDYSFQPLKIGTCVRVLGKITTHRDIRELMIYDLHQVFDPNQELLHTCQVLSLKREYEKEFKLPTRIEMNLTEIESQLEQENRQKSTQMQEDNGDAQFEEALLEYYTTLRSETFSSTTARDNPELVKLATGLLKQEGYAEEPSRKELSDYFGRAFNSLLRNGYIAEFDKEKKLYKVIDDAEFRECVMKIITETIEEMDDYHGGIRLEYITCKINEIPEYSRCKARVKRTINCLIEECYLYPVNEKDYKPVL